MRRILLHIFSVTNEATSTGSHISLEYYAGDIKNHGSTPAIIDGSMLQAQLSVTCCVASIIPDVILVLIDITGHIPLLPLRSSSGGLLFDS